MVANVVKVSGTSNQNVRSDCYRCDSWAVLASTVASDWMTIDAFCHNGNCAACSLESVPAEIKPRRVQYRRVDPY